MTSCAFLSIKCNSALTIKPRDLNTLMIYLLSKPSLFSGENYFSLCMPGIADDGYLQFYIKFFEPEIGIMFAATCKKDCAEFPEKAEAIYDYMKKLNVLESITKEVINKYIIKPGIFPSILY